MDTALIHSGCDAGVSSKVFAKEILLFRVFHWIYFRLLRGLMSPTDWKILYVKLLLRAMILTETLILTTGYKKKDLIQRQAELKDTLQGCTHTHTHV